MNETVQLLIVLLVLPSESYSISDQYERLVHGRQLRIFLPKGSQKLEFTPADDPSKTFLYWENGRLRSAHSTRVNNSCCCIVISFSNVSTGRTKAECLAQALIDGGMWTR